MKRFMLVIALMLISLASVPAAEQVKETYEIHGQVEYDDNTIETIYLDDDIDKPQVNIPQHSVTLPVGVLNITSNTNTYRSALARSMTARNPINTILPLSGSISESNGGFSYGTTWGEELSYSQIESTTGMFLRYDTPKYFSMGVHLRQTATQDIGTQYGSMRFTPELHITDKLTLKDSFTNYVNLPKKKNEITIVYTPALKKYADSLKFELGFAQSFYANGNQSAALNFSTGFKL